MKNQFKPLITFLVILTTTMWSSVLFARTNKNFLYVTKEQILSSNNGDSIRVFDSQLKVEVDSIDPISLSYVQSHPDLVFFTDVSDSIFMSPNRRTLYITTEAMEGLGQRGVLNIFETATHSNRWQNIHRGDVVCNPGITTVAPLGTGDYLLGGCGDDDNLYLFDRQQNQAIRDIDLHGIPKEMVVDPLHAHVFAAPKFGGGISRISFSDPMNVLNDSSDDNQTHHYTGQHGIIRSTPQKMAITPDGSSIFYIYETDFPSSQRTGAPRDYESYYIYRYETNPPRSVDHSVPDMARYPTDLVVHPSLPHLYVTSHLDDEVVVFDTRPEQSLALITRIPVKAGPVALDFSQSGDRLYVVSQIEKGISVIDTATNQVLPNETIDLDFVPLDIAVSLDFPAQQNLSEKKFFVHPHEVKWEFTNLQQQLPQQTVRLISDGGLPVFIHQLHLTQNTGRISIDRNTCGSTHGGVFSLDGHESCNVKISCQPQRIITYRETLTVVTDDPVHPTYSIPVTCKGLEGPAISVTPQNAGFFYDDKHPGLTAPQLITITNTGNSWPSNGPQRYLDITSFYVAGLNAPANVFKITGVGRGGGARLQRQIPTSLTQIPEGAQRIIEIQCDPSQGPLSPRYIYEAELIIIFDPLSLTGYRRVSLTCMPQGSGLPTEEGRREFERGKGGKGVEPFDPRFERVLEKIEKGSGVKEEIVPFRKKDGRPPR